MAEQYDFCGIATKYNQKCEDGLTIRTGAFSAQNGAKVPLVWNHQHGSVSNVLGHAILEERNDCVYARCKFNKTQAGRDAKETLTNGDIEALSIYAGGLSRKGSNVMHGVIREVSLVLAGCNPGALIDTATIAHTNGVTDVDEIMEYDEAVIYHSFDDTEIELIDDDDLDEDSDELSHAADKENEKVESNKNFKDPTPQEVWDSMNDAQQTLCVGMVAEALNSAEADTNSKNDKEDEEMTHNVFESNGVYSQGPSLTVEDRQQILADAKKYGSLKESLKHHLEDEGGVLMHAYPENEDGTTQTYGIANIDWLFPEARYVSNQPPEFIKRDDEWVSKLMNGTKHTPFSRVKTMFADITEDEARARGYTKGNKKIEEVFTLLKRKTDPQTIYKKQKLDRDDIIDITDFDVVAYIRSEMRMMLNEEIARAVLIGDGRSSASDDKISEDHIRPIWTDDDLFTIHVQLPHIANETDEARAKRIIKAAIRARKEYKGSGNPKFFTTADEHTEMLLLEDGNGYSLYKTDNELATKIRCSEIVEVPVMENQSRTVDSTTYDLVAIIVNPSDYNIGADKGGEIANFEDFDIDYNQYKYLIETRCSGALVRPKSAIAIEIAEA